ncbi:hypothetical protein [Streptomyces sp. NPDC093089]|uniref:hypothetical protein n=1 Tax=Streptomyces sp. NPDC093089 TaxID=3366024 RepID=UPI00381043B8
MRKKVATTVGAAALAVAGVLGSAGQSVAGSSGQQIHFHDTSTVVYSIRIEGYNQNGESVSGCFLTPSRDTWISGWWWRGEARVTFYRNNSCSFATYYGDTIASVPAEQSGNWTTVYS